MASSSEISGIILAGGASRRLPNADKLSADVGGSRLVERVYATLGEFCRETIVVGEAGREAEIPDARRVRDFRSGRQGPLAGLEAGLSEASGSVAFVAAGDMPFVCARLALHLCELVAGGGDLRAAVPRYAGRAHPLCAAYEAGVSAEVSSALDGGVRSMKGFLASLSRVEYVERELERFGDPGKFLMNVNSPEDLELARSMV